MQYDTFEPWRTGIPTSFDYVPEPPTPPDNHRPRDLKVPGLAAVAAFLLLAFLSKFVNGTPFGYPFLMLPLAAAAVMGYYLGLPAIGVVILVHAASFFAWSSDSQWTDGTAAETVIAAIVGAVVYRLRRLSRELSLERLASQKLRATIRSLRSLFDDREKVHEKTEGELRQTLSQLEEKLSETARNELVFRQQNDLLESRVRERTAELDAANKELTRQLTDIEKADESQRASDQLYRELFENATDIVYTHSLDGKILTFNKAALRLTGYEPEDMPTLSISALIEPTHLPRAMGMIRRKVDDGRPTRYELDILTRDKRRVPVEVSTRLIFDKGKPVAVQGIARDISERRQAERIQQNNLRYLESINVISQAMEHATDANVMIQQVIDHVLDIFDADRAWLVYPCDPNAEVVTVPYETTKPEYPGVYAAKVDFPVIPMVSETFRAALAKDGPISATGPWNPADLIPGIEKIHATIHSTLSMAIRPKLGKPWLLGLHQCSGPREWSKEERRLFRDIASRLCDGITNLLLHRDLVESEKKYRSLFENSRDGICRTSPSGQLVDVNPTLVTMLGYESKAELLAVDSETLCEEQSEWNDAIRGGFRAIQMRKKDGSELWVEGNFRAVNDEQGNLAGFEGILRDITERRQLESQVRHTQKLESLGVLAGGIAHDFNNLLMGILGNAGLALMDIPNESSARDSVEKIETAALRAADLTNQMLAYSGKGKFLVQPVSLSRLVEEMTHLLDTVISKKTKVTYDFAKDLPLVEGDATQLRQVIMNLITNASDAIGDSIGTISVRTNVLRLDDEYLTETYLDDELPEGDYVFLEVTDSGSGMDHATISKIFDPFFTTKFTGRGLGLAAVLGIVRGHHGAIKVYSEPGIGSTFKVLLPAVGGTASLPVETSKCLDDYFGSGTVLVVDDEETIRAVTTKTLERFGYTVLTAVDGQSAVEIFREQPNQICLVLLDMTMPRMSGDEAFRAIRAVRPDIRVILSSGFSEQEATHRFSGAGLAGFIQKPYRPTDLLEKVHEILNHAEIEGPTDEPGTQSSASPDARREPADEQCSEIDESETADFEVNGAQTIHAHVDLATDDVEFLETESRPPSAEQPVDRTASTDLVLDAE